MALTPSRMMPLGTTCPDFSLPDGAGKLWHLREAPRDRPVLVMFICNHCPYVKHIREGLAALGRDYGLARASLVAINANDAEAYPEDSPKAMVEEAKRAGYVFPYLFDESQAVAKAFDAACTPEFYLFDAGRRLVYRGEFDKSRPGSGVPVTGHELRLALESVLNGQPVSQDQKPSVGCNIKWRKGR